MGPRLGFRLQTALTSLIVYEGTKIMVRPNPPHLLLKKKKERLIMATPQDYVIADIKLADWAQGNQDR